MKIKNIVIESLQNIKEIQHIKLAELEILPIPEKINGHYCLNIAFKHNLSNEIQEILKINLQNHKLISKVEIIKKYINITLNQEYFINSINDLNNNNIIPDVGKGKKVNVEFCSVNPTGYLHIGHARNTILGDSIANILIKTNHKVTKEYYINDGGNQIDILAESIYARYCESNKISYKFPENGYIGEEIYEAAKTLSPNLSMQKIKNKAVHYFLRRIKNDLKKMDIIHDIWVHESDIINKNYIQKAIQIFEKQDMITYGTLNTKQVQKGDISTNNLLLLKTSLFGDVQDRPLTKANGNWTYFAPDIGYHLNKIEREFDSIICILGADHDNYAKRMKIAMHCLDKNVKYIPILCQIVSFENQGELVKFSKRKGNSIRIRDFIKKIPIDALKFMMLEKSNDTQFVFNYENAINITEKNPTFYCKYAYARASSILRNAKISNPVLTKDIFFDNKDVQNFILLLEQFESNLKEVAITLSPYKITNYLKKISEKMHKTWQIGKENNQYKIITNNSEITNNRLILIQTFKKISKECFDCLGITPQETM